MVISIHAPRTGSDKGTIQARLNTIISIHAPRTGSDSGSKCGRSIAAVFQSTLPARGATCLSISLPSASYHFNPRSPHGERLATLPHAYKQPRISIHAPRTGSDQLYELGMLSPTQFQSTLPARGATLLMPFTAMLAIFQSTLPARGATACEAVQVAAMCVFQSTLPARGATRKLLATLSARSHFNPRSPHGERRYRAKTTAARMKHFNPRSPHGERLGSLAMQLEYL